MKILDTNFRKELYKSLVDAGYDKTEAQKIVGVKYVSALKDNVNDLINQIKESFDNGTLEIITDEWAVDINTKLSEIKKMQSVI